MRRLLSFFAVVFAVTSHVRLAMAGEILRSPEFYQRRYISVVIEGNREINKESSASPGDEDCNEFKLTELQVRSYLRNSKPVDDPHDYQIGGCSAHGRLEFADGTWGGFTIMSSRTGYLMLPGGDSFFMFCRYERCRDKVFHRYAGVNSDSEDAAKEDRLQKAAAAARRRQERASGASR